MFALVITSSLSAQSWIDRWTDESYLPESGDWAIGFDATSTLDYFGNLLNSSASAPTADYVSQDSLFSNTFYGKLMTDDGAWRVRVGLNMYRHTLTEEVLDVSATANAGSNQFTEDKTKTGNTEVNLWLGKEWRKGPTRLQGFYGGEAGFMMESETMKKEWGNTAEYGGVGVKEDKSGLIFGMGLRGFIGAEYFVLPRMSVGAEYGWAFVYKLQGRSKTTTTAWTVNNSGNYWEEETISEGDKESHVGFKNDIGGPWQSSGSLVLKMYF